ncbi:MAG: sodium ion-translocating decarboxylase subunit beta, partial [Thiovulaceae bacterium]|nr:sodium ion-translocating decarboxylase subunit beta [Sulfurimonadaceae bacterium]
MKLFILKLLAVFMLFGMSSAYASSSAHAEAANSTHKEETYQSKPFAEMIGGFLKSTGINALV